jgi:hypothetical protein
LASAIRKELIYVADAGGNHIRPPDSAGGRQESEGTMDNNEGWSAGSPAGLKAVSNVTRRFVNDDLH